MSSFSYDNHKTLILDLDDTIFETASMDRKVFLPFFKALFLKLSSHYSTEQLTKIENDLWKNTWDVVMRDHGIPRELMLEATSLLDELPGLNISPYPDYSYIKSLQCRKFLVTTSLTSLQQNKINALGIAGDFEKIIINDPFRGSTSKLDRFRELSESYDLVPGHTYVIGDNSRSEIEAGNVMGFRTIQILRKNVTKGSNAQHYISFFNELEPILNGDHH